MYKFLVKYIFIFILPIITFGTDYAYSHKKFDTNNTKIQINNEANIKTSKNINSNDIDLITKFDQSFNNFSSFEEVIKPQNQFKSLFGIGGFQERRLKQSAFKLWDLYENESSKQIGNQRLNGSDINNTFNESLKDL